MKTLFCTLMLATLTAAAAKASITFAFDNPNQTGAPGQTLQFFGTISDTDDAGSPSQYLNSDSPTLNGVSLTFNDLFFVTVPISLAPGTDSGDIELFDVIVSDPLVDAPGTYTGSYTLLGGPDGGDNSAQNVLSTAGFSVTTGVPEPSEIYPLLLGVALVAVRVISKKVRV